MSNTVLSMSDAITLAEIIVAVGAGQKVGFLPEADPTRDVMVGTLRHICNEDTSFLRDEYDVRDAFVRITLTTGFEYMMPVREAIRLRQDGAMALDYTE